MIPLNPEPKNEKNYLIALVLSMVVMLGYPFVLKLLYPPAQHIEKSTDGEPATPDAGTPREEYLRAKKPQPISNEPLVEPEIVRFENELYEAEFSTRGGSVTRLVYKGDAGRQQVTRNVLFEGVPFEPGLLTLRISQEPVDLSRAIFRVLDGSENRDEIIFQFEKPGQFRITKHFVLSHSEPIISLDVAIENLASETRQIPLEFDAGIHADHLLHQQNPHEFSIVAWNGKAVTADMKHVSKKGFHLSENVAWAGVVKKYFAILLKPEWKTVAVEGRSEDPILWSTLLMEPLSVKAGETVRKEIFVYAGPQRYETLASFNVGFENMLSRGFFGPLKILFLKALKASHRFTHNFGWDIILLTLILKLLFAPFTHMSYKSMEKMKAIQPKLKSLQERYKNDPARLNKEMMELYKRNRVNPMGGCLPMVLQIPIFIAFYQVLNEAIELKGAPFIGWIHNLAEPDRLFMFPFSLPVVGDSFNLLPLFMIASMVVQQKMTPQSGVSPEQQKVFAFMPLVFGFIFYNMPSGLVLYWFLNNVLSIIQQGFVKRIVVTLHHEDRHSD